MSAKTIGKPLCTRGPSSRVSFAALTLIPAFTATVILRQADITPITAVCSRKSWAYMNHRRPILAYKESLPSVSTETAKSSD